MKKLFILFLLLFMLVNLGIAQNKSVGIYSGYAVSLIDRQPDYSSSLPIGIFAAYQILPYLETGIELNALAFPFESSEGPERAELTQYYSAFFGKVSFDLGNIHPFVRLGLGYYFGKYEGFENDQAREIDFTSGTLGAFYAAGLEFMDKYYFELMLHNLEHEMEEESFSTSSAVFNIGYQYRF